MLRYWIMFGHLKSETLGILMHCSRNSTDKCSVLSLLLHSERVREDMATIMKLMTADVCAVMFRSSDNHFVNEYYSAD